MLPANDSADDADRVKLCQAKAEECRRMAESALSEATRESFLDRARSYDALAKEIEAQKANSRPSLSPSP
jgi:hypothetical protein